MCDMRAGGMCVVGMCVCVCVCVYMCRMCVCVYACARDAAVAFMQSQRLSRRRGGLILSQVWLPPDNFRPDFLPLLLLLLLLGQHEPRVAVQVLRQQAGKRGRGLGGASQGVLGIGVRGREAKHEAEEEGGGGSVLLGAKVRHG